VKQSVKGDRPSCKVQATKLRQTSSRGRRSADRRGAPSKIALSLRVRKLSKARSMRRQHGARESQSACRRVHHTHCWKASNQNGTVEPIHSPEPQEKFHPGSL